MSISILRDIVLGNATMIPTGASPSIGYKLRTTNHVYFCKIFFKNPKDCLDIIGLRYEEKVYSTIVPRLTKQSPNFVRYVATFEINPDKVSDPEEIKVYLKLVNYLKAKSISDCGDSFDVFQKSAGLTVVVCESVEGSKQLGDFLSKNQLTEIEIRQIVCQLVISLTLLNEQGLMHNDLHLNNILVKEVNKDLIYLISGKSLVIPDVRYQIYIFDWDYAFSKELGDNPKIDSVKKFGITNDLDQRFDLFIALCNLTDFVRYDSGFVNFINSISDDWVSVVSETNKNFHCRLPNKKIRDLAFAHPEEDLLVDMLRSDYFRDIVK